MEPNFQLDFLSTVIVLKNYTGKIIKTSKKLSSNFYQMKQIENDIYLDCNNVYWKKNISFVTFNNQKYIQEEYTDITKYYLENKRLLDNLKKDPLTKIFNLTAIQGKVNDIILSNSNCTIVMCDVNDFKGVNDTYGHAVGDKVLIEISKLFKNEICEDNDMVARIGGDEFLFIIMSNDIETNLRKLFLLKEKVRILGKNMGLPLSVSMGVSYFNSGDIWEQKQKEADKALYYVKNNSNSKNAISYYDDETAKPIFYDLSEKYCYIKNK